MRRPRSADGVRRLRVEADNAVDGYLQASGWTYTSDNPASLWLWRNTIGGVVYLVPKDVALRIEERIEDRDR